jgi:hypothetical protein
VNGSGLVPSSATSAARAWDLQASLPGRMCCVKFAIWVTRRASGSATGSQRCRRPVCHPICSSCPCRLMLTRIGRGLRKACAARLHWRELSALVALLAVESHGQDSLAGWLRTLVAEEIGRR